MTDERELAIRKALAWADRSAGQHPRHVDQHIKDIAAEVRRYQTMRCDGCKHRYQHATLEIDICGNAGATCERIGGGCLAWEKRDG